MVPPRLVEMMGAEIPVEPVLVDRSVAEEPVFARPTVLEDNAEMTVAEETLVDLVHLHNHAPTDFVPVQPPLTVLEDSAVITEPEETVVAAQQDKDAVQDFANAIMTVMTEIVEQPFKLMEQISHCAHKDLVEHVPPVLLVEPMEDAQLRHLVTLSSPLLIAPADVQ